MDESPDWYSSSFWRGDGRITSYKMERFNDWGYSVKEIGADKARGEYLCFPADDSQYKPEFVAEMTKPETDLVYCDWFFGKIGSSVKVLPQVGSIDIGGFIVRKSVWEKYRFFDKGSCGDGMFVLKVCEKHTHERVPLELYIEE